MANPGKSEAAASGSSHQQNKDNTEGQGAATEGDAAGKQRLEGKVDLALLNEDDDFEEFPAEEWDEVDPTTQTTKVCCYILNFINCYSFPAMLQKSHVRFPNTTQFVVAKFEK